MTREIDNNKTHLIGKIMDGFAFNHEKCGENFYTANLEIKRLSDKTDIIPIMISDRIINISEDCDSKTMKISGQFRSYNRREGSKNHLMLYVFVTEAAFIEEFTDYTKVNHILLDGYICNAPTYRTTPLGREIADVLLAVNRSYGKSDYIPCVFWGRNARYVSRLDIGSHIKVEGRVQSRKYQKRISETETETRTAYEVSVSSLELVWQKDSPRAAAQEGSNQRGGIVCTS